jgi:polyisoprenoid-binding protein YceI
MPTDEAKLNELPGRFVTDPDGTGHVTATDRSHPSPVGTWTIDPAASTVSFAWRKLRLWTITGRLHGMGVIQLDGLPPVGVVRFQQPSGLPVLTMTLDSASVETQDADLDALLGGPDYFDAVRHRWWTLRSESLEVLPTGTWRVMATLTARGTAALVELRFAVIPGASGPDGLVLRGRGVLEPRAFGIGKQAWGFDPQIRLDLVVRANRAAIRTRNPMAGRGSGMNNQHAELSQALASQRITERHQQVAHARLWGARPPRRRRTRWAARRWWQLARWPRIAIKQPAHHPYRVS